MTDTLLLGVVALVAAGAGLLLLDLTIRRAEVGAALVFGSAVLQAVFIFAVPSVSVPGGARIGITDLAAVTVLTAAVARCLRLQRFDRYQRWLSLLGALLLVSLAHGLVAEGVQASLNDARQYIFFVGAALYVSTFHPSRGLYRRVGLAWLAGAFFMMVLASVRWLSVFGGVDLGVPAERYGVDTPTRVLDGPYAFLLAGALLITAPSWLRRDGDRRLRWAGLVLLVLVLVLDRRTVWLALLLGVAVLLLRGRRLRRRAVVTIAVGGVVLLGSFFVDAVVRDDARPGTTDASTGTLAWRAEGWRDLVVGYAADPVNWAVGEPFGSGFTRAVEGTTVQSHPHNFFLQTMFRSGVPGLIALVALTAGLLHRLWRLPRPGGSGATLLDPGVLPALLAMQVVWYLTWIPGIEQGLVTGLAVAAARLVPRRPPRTRDQRPNRRPSPRVAGGSAEPAATEGASV